MKPLVSIIVPNYNHEKYLIQRIESILEQTYENFELILLDDASTDSSVAILEKYKNHPKVSHFIINEANSGSPFKQWQKGISLAKGEYIWIAESDDYSDKHFIDKIIDQFNLDKELGVVYCQTNDVNEKGELILNRLEYTSEFNENIWQSNFILDGNEFIKKYLSVKNVIPNASAVVFKKELISEDIFSDDLLAMKMCGDWYFWIKILRYSKIGFINESLNNFRNHSSVSRNHYNFKLQRVRLVEEYKIRAFLSENSVNISQNIKKFHKKWFAIYILKGIFKKSFFDIKPNNMSKFKFVLRYICYKIFNN